jgi:hypothetical protein
VTKTKQKERIYDELLKVHGDKEDTDIIKNQVASLFLANSVFGVAASVMVHLPTCLYPIRRQNSAD